MSGIYKQINGKGHPKTIKIFSYLNKDQLIEKDFNKNIQLKKK